MKIKNPYIAIVAIFILAISIYSCRKDFMGDDVQVDPKVAWAKNYFRETLLPDEGNVVDAHNYVDNVLQANLMTKKKENHKIPIWQKAMEGRTSEYEFVEVPLKYTTKVTPMLSRISGSSPQADKGILKASLDRLIIFKKRNGDIDQRIITFIPSKPYLDRHNGDISHNRINKLDRDFDGALIYRKWNGAFESALVVKNGKGIKRILLNKFAPKFKKAAFEGEDEDCGTFNLLEWFQDCYYEGDNPEPIYCDEPYSVIIGQIEIPCPEDDPEFDPCLLPENFELCNPGGSEGGGNGGEENEPVIEWGEAESDSPSDISIVNDTTKNVSWICYNANGGSVKFRSYETIRSSIHYSGWTYTEYWKTWSIESATHTNMLVEGSISGQSISPELAYTEDNSDNSVARIKVVFKDYRTYNQNGQAKSSHSEDKTATNAWTKAALGWQDVKAN